MKIFRRISPRRFQVGVNRQVTISDCGSVELEPNEQITFRTNDHVEYDVVRKSWGYYLTPSLNKRLISFGLHAALIRNNDEHYYLVLVEDNRRSDFASYLTDENLYLITWLDSDLTLGLLDE